MAKKKSLGCDKVIGVYRMCGEVSFSNKLILCGVCLGKVQTKIARAVKQKWEAERNHCGNCDESGYCSTCKPEFDKLNEIIKIRDVLE